MKRILLMFLTNFFKLPYLLIRTYQLQNTDKYSAADSYKFLRKNIRWAVRGGRIHIVSTGTENLPKTDGYIMFPNHQGMFDVLTFIYSHERPLATVMKKENKAVPLLKRMIPLLRAELIDREDIRQSLKVIQNMTKRVSEGEIFVIFAEGTRSREGNKLTEFKGGSFKSAMNAHCPIVPVALIDSFKAFDTSSIRKITVQIHYLTPICYDEYKDLKSTEIAAMVTNRIQTAIDDITAQ